MVKIYVELILKGVKTIDDVPDLWKSAVKKAFAELEAD